MVRNTTRPMKPNRYHICGPGGESTYKILNLADSSSLL